MTVSTTDRPQKQLLGKLHVKSILVVETGLHIGGGGETLNIGGLDKPVIRDPLTQRPYLPGSSIKGKLRAILERLLNKPLNRKGSRDTYRYESGDLVDGVTEIDGQFIKFQGAKTCEVSRVFGSTGVKCWIETEIARREELLDDNSEKKQIDGKEYAKVTGRNAPARLIVRDCHLIEDSARELERVDTGLYMTEWKFENGLDRVTAAANPRQVERVPKGAKYQFEMVYTVEDATQAREDLRNILRAILVLEDDALGGHGSRGYGKIKFQNLEFLYRDYQGISEQGSSALSLPSHKELSAPIQDTTQLPDKFDEIQKLLPEEGQQ
ncbi:MAG: type III-A CRISPR-associated RAMP protein Csm3 [Oscillatoriaceae cyanobacterium Prado104]|jgi:CRISPR-associated protein Csm3|nr:type III-A CRISPR-associated RAMP protein Csm3 [Oscillatoriaceae cyanobacterium Prado104]